MVDSMAHLDNQRTISLAVGQNRTILAPLLARPGALWTNFWGALSADGWYKRSEDYVDIVQGQKRGLWNVPYINNAIMFRADDDQFLGELKKAWRPRPAVDYSTFGQSQSEPAGQWDPFVERDPHDVDADLLLTGRMIEQGRFMYLLNTHDFGHLVNADQFDVTRTSPDLYEMFTNPQDWENRYIHENYSNFREHVQEPCPDVYWFPLASKEFCSELIDVMNAYGQWSSGSYEDERLSGGYENVPTRDIHMNQVGLEEVWLEILNKYVRPVQEEYFIGYYSDPKPRAVMNFVVRYMQGEQPSLRAHHDASTYTINVALNRAGLDYDGGGCRFLRYNCNVTDTRRGWSFIHPGRLTHIHEGLTTTAGIRYIMVSFVDP